MCQDKIEATMGRDKQRIAAVRSNPSRSAHGTAAEEEVLRTAVLLWQTLAVLLYHSSESTAVACTLSIASPRGARRF